MLAMSAILRAAAGAGGEPESRMAKLPPGIEPHPLDTKVLSKSIILKNFEMRGWG